MVGSVPPGNPINGLTPRSRSNLLRVRWPMPTNLCFSPSRLLPRCRMERIRALRGEKALTPQRITTGALEETAADAPVSPTEAPSGSSAAKHNADTASTSPERVGSELHEGGGEKSCEVFPRLLFASGSLTGRRR